jgi:hypothetical protein
VLIASTPERVLRAGFGEDRFRSNWDIEHSSPQFLGKPILIALAATSQ